MAKLYSPGQISWLSSLYTACCWRSSSRSQVAAKVARRVDGQNSSAVTSKKKLRLKCKVCMFEFSIDARRDFFLWSPTVCVCPLLSFSVQNTQNQISNWLHYSYWSACHQDKVAMLCPAKWLRNGHDSSQSETALEQPRFLLSRMWA